MNRNIMDKTSIKGWIVFLVVFALGFTFLLACGSKESNDYSFDKDYKKMEKLFEDFEKIRDELSGELGSKRYSTKSRNFSKIVSAATKYTSFVEQVVCKEARYLISLNNEDAHHRLSYLFNELKMIGDKLPEGTYMGDLSSDELSLECYKQYVKCNNNLCNVVLNLGLSEKNNQVCELAMSHYLANAITTDAHSVHYEETDKKEAEKKYLQFLVDGARITGDYSLVDRYVSNAEFSISDIDIITFLSSTNKDSNSEIIIDLLAPLENEIPTKPNIGKTKTKEYDYDRVCRKYSKSIKTYNDECKKLLRIAIKTKNRYLAQILSTKFKQNVNCVKLPDIWDARNHQHIYVFDITVDNEDVQAAKTALQEAVQSGAFN